MRVCLVSALTIPDFGDPDRTIEATPIETRFPLGILSLAAVLEEHGIHPEILDLDRLFIEYITQRKNNSQIPNFITFSKEKIVSQQFDVIGFSSLCSSFPFTIRLAIEIKQTNSHTTIILGGPQASMVDVPTMERFSPIDFIVRHEADDTFPKLLELLANPGSGSLETIQGITYRRGAQIIKNPNAPVIADLDRLPLPAFHLLPPISGKSCPLEIGRGCPFQCTFCSTSNFFGRRFRLKSPQKMIEHMRIIKDRYKVDNFSFNHDMFTANRPQVVQFCESMLACQDDGFKWSCSARTDCVDDELIALMAKAGCTGIFFGIETGSQRLQHVIRKKLNLSEATKRIECASTHQISTAVALIIAFPDETKHDLRDTLHFFIDSLRFDYAEPQLSLLAPLAGTPLQLQYKDQLVFDRLFSNISHQGWKMDQADLDIIISYPDIFPNFYAIPTIDLERNYFQEVQDFIVYLSIWLHWLPVILLQDSGDFLKVFDRWKVWWRKKYVDDTTVTALEVPYLNQGQFPKDFLEFMRDCYIKEMAQSPAIISEYIESDGIKNLKPRGYKQELKNIIDQNEFTLSSYPYQPANVWMVNFNLDYNKLLQCLRNKENLEHVSTTNGNVLFQRIHKEFINVHRLSSLSEELWKLCDGTKTVGSVVEVFSHSHPSEFDGIPIEKACMYGLQQLKEQGLLGVSSLLPA